MACRYLRPTSLCLLLPGLLLALAAHAAGDGAPSLGSYSSSVELEQDKAYLYWSIDDADSSIHMALQARTSGWAALGISEVGAMVGSDVMLGWVADGSAVMTDRFIFNKSLDASGVALDQSQDVRIVAGSEYPNATSGDTWTVLHFWRPLNTTDCNDRAIARGEHVSLIWAMGEGDTPAYHGSSRGGTTVVLAQGGQFAVAGRQVPTTPDTVAVKTESQPGRGLLARKVAAGDALPATLVQGEDWLNLTATSYPVSTNDTTYICNTFNVTYPAKKHIVEFGVILNTTNPETVHHIVVWACTDSDQPIYANNFECFSQANCSQTFAVWAVGGLPVTFPPAAGLPVGPGGFRTLVLQIHYTNPNGLDTIIDNSGMYMKLSPSLRKYDAGILGVGPVSFTLLISIPPLQPAWTQDTLCPSACTQRLANTSEGLGNNITVFASMMHQHTIGRQLYTELYRDGTKLFTVGRQDYYDFSYQQFKDLSPGFYVLPGDEMRTRCVWDSSEKTTVTKGGFATYDEMCINYLIYYPARESVFGSCFDFCMPKDGQTGPLVHAAACGGNVIPLNSTCPAGWMGNNVTTFEAVAGCSLMSTPSLASLDMGSISVPAGEQPGSTPKADYASRASSLAIAAVVLLCSAFIVA